MKKKIFLGFYNWGTQAGLHSKMLRDRGYNSESFIFEDRFNRQADKKISMPKNYLIHRLKRLLIGIKLFVQNFHKDVFIFYGGSTFLPMYLDLKILTFFGKNIVFYYMGNDVQGYQLSLQKYKYTNMRFYCRNHAEGIKYDRKISKRLAKHRMFATKQIVCAPMYSEFVPNCSLLPLVINLDNYYFEPTKQDVINILHAPSVRDVKGTSYIQYAVDLLVSEGYNVALKIVENTEHEELINEYRKCDIFVDQLLAGWYGTASIEAMASYKTTVCFLRESYREHCSYFDELPIVNANPDNIYQCLKNLITDPSVLKDLGIKSRKFVEKFHSPQYVIPALEELINLK